MKKEVLVLVVIVFGVISLMSFTKSEKTEIIESTGGNIGIYLKWSDGGAATNIKVQLGECGGGLSDSSGYTDNNGYIELYNYDSYYACAIYAKGDKYKKKMENGSSYTFYLN